MISEDIEYVLAEQNRTRFSALGGATLLLTGGTGFLGTWLLEWIAYLNDHCFEKPCQVFIVTRDPQAFSDKAPHLCCRPEFTFLVGDIGSFPFPNAPCDYVIHAAAPTDRRYVASRPLDVAETVLAGTKHVLELAASCSVKRLLFVSSGAVYGIQPPQMAHMPETHAGAPQPGTAASAYAEAKRLAEVFCAVYREHYGLPVVIARPFTFLGPYQPLDAGFAVTDLIRDGLNGAPLHIKSDGSALRSYAYGADAACWLLTILLHGRPGEAYNVGSGEPISILSLAQRIVALLKSWDILAEIEVDGTRSSSALPDRYVPDVSRARLELGLECAFDLDRALRRTLEWQVEWHRDKDMRR